MKKIIAAGLFALMTAGCSRHYYVVSENSMDIYLEKPAAEEVVFASSLDGFELHQTRNEEGRWVISLPSDSRFRYFYITDGNVFVPPCRLMENDDFGSKNCIYEPGL